jgi:hypothetical protein
MNGKPLRFPGNLTSHRAGRRSVKPLQQPLARPMNSLSFHWLVLTSNRDSNMHLKSKATSSKSLGTLTAFLAHLVAQRIEIHRKARLVKADLKVAELTEMNEHAALQSIKEASGWGGGMA